MTSKERAHIKNLTLIPIKNVGNNSDDLQFVQLRTVD